MSNFNEIIQEINTNLPDNDEQLITAKKLRDTLVDNMYNTTEEYDISANHSGTKYANLTAALGTNGGNVPVNIRKGGMTVRFVNNSSKYEHWRYTLSSITDTNFANEVNWQGVDDEPTIGSNNLVKSSGVYEFVNINIQSQQNQIDIIKNKICSVVTYTGSADFNDDHFYKLNLGIGETAPTKMSSITKFACFITKVKTGDIITIKTYGGGNAKAYALTDKNRIIYDIAPSDADYTNGITITATQDGYLYVNNSNEKFELSNVEVKITQPNKIENIENDIEQLKNDVYGSVSYNNSNFTNGYMYNLSAGVGGTAPDSKGIHGDWACFRIKVRAGQTINVKTIGGNSARAYALTDTNRTILSVAPANADYSSGLTLNVTQDGYLYVNTTVAYLPNVSVTLGSVSKIDTLENTVSGIQNDVSGFQSDISNLQNDVSIIQNDLSGSVSYNNSNFTNGYMYNLSAGVGGTAPDSKGIHGDWACFRIKVRAGQTINVKTIGGNDARAYALTDTNRTILSVAPAKADYSSGLTLNVTQDGYLYVNTTVAYLPNVSVVILGNKIDMIEGNISELQNDVSELQDDVSELQAGIGASKIYNPNLDLTKDNLKILDIGNSFTQDTTHYLPNIIANHNIPNTYSLYQLIRGGSSFKTWVDCYNDADTLKYGNFFVAGQTLADVPTGASEANDGTMFRNVLTSVKWDMIIIHQVSTYSADYTLWEGNGKGGYLKEYIRILKLTNPQAKIGFYLVHSATSNSDLNPDHSSLVRWQKIANSVKWMMTNYGVDFVIPYGTAVQNIRQCSIVDSNELSDDGRHNASGLGDYTASCCYFQQLFGARNGVNVMGDNFRITVDESVAGQVSVTDDTAPLAQKAAILACSDAFSITNPEKITL